MLNQAQNWQQTKIVKISPNNVMRVFSNINFANSLAAAVGQGYEAVYHLRLACTISLSFVVGCGGEYRHQDFTSTPCWIEISLNGPLTWLDKVLSKMDSPNFSITSDSEIF